MSRILQIIEQAQSKAARRDIQLPTGRNSISFGDAVSRPADQRISSWGNPLLSSPISVSANLR